MNLTLSWDLFIIVFFALVVTYTFIIGKKQSIKMIIATYIAIVAVQGLGNVLQRLSAEQSGTAAFQVLGMTMNMSVISVVKLVLFVAAVIALTVKAGFDVVYDRETMVLNVVFTALCGIATAGLLFSALLTYAANMPLLDSGMASVPSLATLAQQSKLMQLLIFNQDLWFAFPAVVLIAAGFASND